VKQLTWHKLNNVLRGLVKQFTQETSVTRPCVRKSFLYFIIPESALRGDGRLWPPTYGLSVRGEETVGLVQFARNGGGNFDELKAIPCDKGADKVVSYVGQIRTLPPVSRT